MYKVVIADDELWLRKGLQKKIRWNDLELSFCGDASDGEEAYHLAIEKQADIVIADVRMPVQDGLKLSEKILSYNKNIKIIVVSGYDEFQYVKTAISFGAVDYILKPVKAEELNNALKKAIDSLEKNKSADTFKKNISDILKKSMNEFILHNKKEDALNFNQWLNKAHIQGHEYSVVLFLVDRSITDIDKVKQDMLAYSNKIANGDFNIIEFERQFSIIGLLIIRMTDKRDIETYIRRLWFFLENNYAQIIFTTIGGCSTSINDIPKLYTRALKLMDSYNDFQSQSNNIVFFNEEDDEKNYEYPAVIHQEILHCIKIKNRSEINAVLEKVRLFFQKNNNISVKEGKKLLFCIISEMVVLLTKENEKYNKLIEKGINICNDIDNYRTLKDILLCIENYVEVYINTAEQSDQSNGETVVRSVLDYIEQNYFENINLNTITKNFHISPSYFSVLFKRYTGENYIDFVTKLRIKKACELLEKTGNKINKISYEVGFNDYKYFCKVFKKYTAMKPSEYRRRNTNENH